MAAYCAVDLHLFGNGGQSARETTIGGENARPTVKIRLNAPQNTCKRDQIDAIVEASVVVCIEWHKGVHVGTSVPMAVARQIYEKSRVGRGVRQAALKLDLKMGNRDAREKRGVRHNVAA